MNARTRPRSIPRLMLLVVLVLSGCSGRTGAAAEDDPLARVFGGEYELVDLTHAISADDPFWPGPEQNPFVHDTISAQPSGRPSMAAYSLPEHHGTHLDAPIHFADGTASVDELPLSGLVGPAVVVDVTRNAEAFADYGMTRQDLLDWEELYGQIPSGSIVLMYSGWSERWTEGDSYMNADADGGVHFPGLSADASSFLVEERSVVGIGVDTPSVDPGGAEGFPAHAVSNGAGLFHLENLAGLDRLPASGAYVMALPIKIKGGSGGQVRVVGVVPPRD